VLGFVKSRHRAACVMLARYEEGRTKEPLE
jgi:hypothetical protein